MTVTIGIDIGGTKIAAGVVDGSGTVIARRQIPTDAGDPQSIVAGITKVARELRAGAPAASAVGVGAAGLVDGERGIVLSAPNIAWENFALREMVADRVGLPVVIDNDANVAAWGEALHGAGRGAGDQIMVTVGTGIGGGIVLGGTLYRGTNGVGAEIGHMIVAAEGPPCGCGNRGCLEAVASGNAIGRVARERAKEPEAAAVLASAGGDPDAITGQDVGSAALGGDPFALSIVAEAGRWLGVGLVSLVHLLDPDVIVVGGGAGSGFGELLIGPARRYVEEHVMGARWRRMVRVIPAELGPDAGVVGAAALARALA